MKEFQGVFEFVQVIESGSFSAAARQIGRSKAFVSQQVAQLEDRLNARLMQRTTRKLSLTAAGEVYYRYAREVVTRLAEGKERVRDFQESLQGRIRISCVDGGLGELYLAPAIARFAALNPGVEVELDLSSRLVDLVAEGFDFAIRVGTLPDSSLISRKLTAFRYGLYASPAYLKRQGLITTPEQLKKHNCLSGATPAWDFTRNAQAISIKPQGSWHSKSGQALIAAAQTGLGVARAASFYAGKSLATGELIEVLSDWTREQSRVWIVYHSGRNLPRRVQSAIHFLLDDFRDQSPWD